MPRSHRATTVLSADTIRLYREVEPRRSSAIGSVDPTWSVLQTQMSVSVGIGWSTEINACDLAEGDSPISSQRRTTGPQGPVCLAPVLGWPEAVSPSSEDAGLQLSNVSARNGSSPALRLFNPDDQLPSSRDGRTSDGSHLRYRDWGDDPSIEFDPGNSVWLRTVPFGLGPVPPFLRLLCEQGGSVPPLVESEYRISGEVSLAES